MSVEICLNEYGDTLDEPYIIRCTKAFNLYTEVYNEDSDDYEVEILRIEEGSEWAIYGPSYESDYVLEGDRWILHLPQYELDNHFEVVYEGRYHD